MVYTLTLPLGPLGPGGPTLFLRGPEHAGTEGEDPECAVQWDQILPYFWQAVYSPEEPSLTELQFYDR